jgi:hypothetical protein
VAPIYYMALMVPLTVHIRKQIVGGQCRLRNRDGGCNRLVPAHDMLWLCVEVLLISLRIFCPQAVSKPI